MVTYEQIEEITRRIRNSCDLQKIILFGSYAYGKPREDSDLDLLVVIKKSSQPRYKRANIIRKHLWGITDTPKDILVYTEDEINDWSQVDQAFITQVVKTGRVLYENKERAN